MLNHDNVVAANAISGLVPIAALAIDECSNNLLVICLGVEGYWFLRYL